MFGAYRIGANTPADIFIPPMPAGARQVRDKCLGVYDLAIDTPSIIDGTMKVSNFLTRQKQGTILGYYSIGAIDPKKLAALPQIPTSIANPQVKISPLSLSKKNSMVDVWLVAVQQATRNYGVYSGDIKLDARSGVPLVTTAMVFDTQSFLLKRFKASKRGFDTTGERERAVAFNFIGKEAGRVFNIRMRQAGVPVRASDLEYIRLLKTMVLPVELAKKFWINFRRIAIDLDSINGRDAFTEWRLLGIAFYEQGRDVVQKVIDAAKKLPDFFETLKTVLIVAAVLIGGFIVWQILGLVAG